MPKNKKRFKQCISCNKNFSYFIGRGRDRKTCSIKCRKNHNRELFKIRFKNASPCSNPNCKNKANRKEKNLCETCYYRVRRFEIFY